MKPFRKLFKSHLKYRIPLEQMNNIYQCESFSQMLIILRVIVKVRVHRLEEENLKWKPMVQSSSKAHLAEATEGKTLKVLREIVHLRVWIMIRSTLALVEWMMSIYKPNKVWKKLAPFWQATNVHPTINLSETVLAKIILLMSLVPAKRRVKTKVAVQERNLSYLRIAPI